ncbi:MAG: diacylglycerol kinase [Thalassobius sp.]|nr:diacylglycerol kinase [Thalassovita sp.]
MKKVLEYFVKELKSFRHAFRGIKFLSSDHNFFFHFPVGILVFILAWYFNLTRQEWLWIILSTGIVWLSEAFNTSIEKTIDLLHPQQHPLAGKVKDIAAAAVFISVLIAGAIGILIFYPYFYAIF